MYISKIFVTVDNVTIRTVSGIKEILLIKRLNEPFKDSWALPGGFVDENEDLAVAARRELFEETSIKVSEVMQFGAYGTPNRDPRNHTISIAYFSEISPSIKAVAADDAKEVFWFDLKNLPPTAFDHAEIIKDAISKFNLL